MKIIMGVLMASILLVGALISPLPSSHAQISQSSPSKSMGLASITSFSNAVVLVSSSSTAGEILRMKLDSLEVGDVQNLGLSVKEAAQLHQLLKDATKEERKDFKTLFHEYKNSVKAILKIGYGTNEKDYQEFSKDAIKIEKAIEKLERKDKVKESISQQVSISQQQKELQKLRNQIGTLTHFLSDGPEKDKILEELEQTRSETYKNILVLKATKNGKVLTEKDLEKIEKKVEQASKLKERNEKTNSSDEKKSKSNKAKGNDAKENKSKDNKGKDKKEKKNKSKGNKK